jgi:hypothetical protein
MKQRMGPLAVETAGFRIVDLRRIHGYFFP